MSKSIQGIFRRGKIEFEALPSDIPDETTVIVTFLEPGHDLREFGIDETQARDLRGRLQTFTGEWESPEMDIYDNYDKVKSSL